MNQSTKLASLVAASAVFVGGALAAAQQSRRTTAPTSARPTPRADAVVVPGSLEWLILSDLSAKREGVLDIVHFNEGARLTTKTEIGRLDDAIAKLTLAKQEVIAKSTGPIAKANAQRAQAKSTLARLIRLQNKMPGSVSQEEIDKASADVNYADALIQEAEEKLAADQVELKLAQQNLEDHSIKAPFNGVIIKRIKNPGEAVRANEAIVSLGQTDKFKFVGWVPLEDAERVRVGDTVRFHPTVEGSELALESKIYEGKVMAIGSEIATVERNKISITAEITNPGDPDHPELDLRQGLKGDLTIIVSGAVANRGNRPATAPVDESVETTARSR